MQGGSTKFILNGADTSSDVFEELLSKNPPLNIQKSIVAFELSIDEAFELSIDELKTFLGLCIICGVIKGRDEILYSFGKTNTGENIQ